MGNSVSAEMTVPAVPMMVMGLIVILLITTLRTRDAPHDRLRALARAEGIRAADVESIEIATFRQSRFTIDAGAPRRHQGEFRRHEKRVRRDQHDHGEQTEREGPDVRFGHETREKLAGAHSTSSAAV